MGKLVVIEGLDGSGKATQTQMMARRLEAAGRKFLQVSFPDYDSPSSALVKMYLEGDFGKRAGDVNAWAASTFFAVDRYASWKTKWSAHYKRGGLVLADRYTTSNMLHQCVKLPQAQREGYVAWLEDFEYAKLGIPRPDLVLYLDVETEVSQKLLSERYKVGGKRDIHESDIAYLKDCRDAALWCCERLAWRRVGCTSGGEMCAKEYIAKELWSILEEQSWFSKK